MCLPLSVALQSIQKAGWPFWPSRHKLPLQAIGKLCEADTKNRSIDFIAEFGTAPGEEVHGEGGSGSKQWGGGLPWLVRQPAVSGSGSEAADSDLEGCGIAVRLCDRNPSVHLWRRLSSGKSIYISLPGTRGGVGEVDRHLPPRHQLHIPPGRRILQPPRKEGGVQGRVNPRDASRQQLPLAQITGVGVEAIA